MSKIIRTPTRVAGGITPEEKIALDAHAKLWIARAMRTNPIEPDKIIPAIEGLYAAAGLKKPRVVIVPSPLVMACAYGAAAAIWDQSGSTATDAATDAATYAATRDATDAATYAATRDATDATFAATDAATRDATDAATRTATVDATFAATRDATRTATSAATRDATRTALGTSDAERGAIRACSEIAGEAGLKRVAGWASAHQGGNMWAPWDSYITGMRDVLGLRLPEHEKYAHWEQAAIHGGFRVLHPEFCIVSDFPEVLKIDAENLPHCETGPSHRWRDGWSLYHWHGVLVPAEWIEDRASLTAKTALTWANIEQRRAACEIVGWSNILKELDAKTIDRDDDPEIGELVEVTIEGNRERFLRVLCGTKREFSLPVPPDVETALAANAWTYGVDGELIKRIEVRT